MSTEFRPCENCKQRISLLYCAFPNEVGFPYLCVCRVCIADIGSWADQLKQMCDDDGQYVWTGSIVDGVGTVLWTESEGQLFDLNKETPNDHRNQ